MLVGISITQNIDRNIYYHFTTAALNKTNWYEKYLIKMECYYFDDIIEIEDFDFNNILIDKKSYQNILVYSISCKTWLGQNHCVLGSIKQMCLLEFMMELNI